MKIKLFAIFLVLALGATGILGFLAVSSMNHTAQHPCPIFVVLNGDCPSNGNILGLIGHHISVLQNFMQSVPFASSFFLTFFIFLAFIFVALPRSEQNISFPQFFSYQKHRTVEELNYLSYKSFFRWLALRNKRDSHVLYLVHEIS